MSVNSPQFKETLTRPSQDEVRSPAESQDLQMGFDNLGAHEREDETLVDEDDDDGPDYDQIDMNFGEVDEVDEQGREITIGRPGQKRFMNNSVSTTRYIMLFKFRKSGWSPKIPFVAKQFDLPWLQFPFPIQNLYEQFQRVANIYFLIIIGLQLIPGLSPTGQFSTLLPFAIVTTFSMIKDGFEDLKRRLSDMNTNIGMKARVFRKGKFTRVKWKDVKVGDMIKVCNKEAFPCDIVLLSSSQESGIAYVETSQLDGETNLKIRKAREDTLAITEETVGDLDATIVCENPNKDLHNFTGTMHINSEYRWKKVVNVPKFSEMDPLAKATIEEILVKVGDKVKEGDPICTIKFKDELLDINADHDCEILDIFQKEGCVIEEGIPLYKFDKHLKEYQGKPLIFDKDQQLLRGSSLRNTEWVIGTVIFTGHETKLMMNQRQTPYKSSHVERQTNKLIFIIFGLLISLCVVCMIGSMIHKGSFVTRKWYLQEYVNGIHFGYVLWEGFKGFWTFLILFNNLVPISLYVSVEVAKFCQAFFMQKDLQMYYKEKDIPMVVRSSSLNEELGQVEYIFSDKTGTLTRNQMDFLKFSVNGVCYGTGLTEIEISNKTRKGEEIISDRPEGFNEEQEFRFWDHRISDGKWTTSPDKKDIEEFFKLLALCHTVIPEKDSSGKIQFTASSPDEASLVLAAHKLGASFLSRSTHSVTISLNGKQEIYTLLNILEFNSDRKRMSVVLRTPEGKLVLYTKGADNVIYERLKPDQEHAEETLEILKLNAEAGLRTLVCAKAEIDETFYQSWNREFQQALQITDPKAKEKSLSKINEEIEKDLELVGITAIEDQLQKGVPFTIAELKKAKIKIWVLTGDKVETAKNIAFACNLLNTDMELIEFDEEQSHDIASHLMERQNHFSVENNRTGKELGLVLDGKQLLTIYADETLKSALLQIATFCSAVVCCRVSPAQKSDIVSLVKDNINTITLAIGDGANDVAMIQAAHVGVGIAGEEGLQAANSSDYSFGQFRFLRNLLLVHGRWSYRRVSKIIMYSFYKNIVLYLTQMWYVSFNAWTGTSVHDKWTVSAYNVFFTFFPIMVLGIFDEDISKEKALDFPQIYARGHRDNYFNFLEFLGWVLNSIFHSAICFFIPMFCYFYPTTPAGSPWDGGIHDQLTFGIVIYTSVLLVVTAKCALEMRSHTIFHFAANIGSLILWWLMVTGYSSVFYLLPHQVFALREFSPVLQQFRVFVTLKFYCVIALTLVIALAKDVLWKTLRRLSTYNLYYAVQDASRRVKTEDDKLNWQRTIDKLVEKYPIPDRDIPFKTKLDIGEQFSDNIEKIRESADRATKKVKHYGYAFSQTAGQLDLINRILKKPGTRSGNVTKHKKKSEKSETIEYELTKVSIPHEKIDLPVEEISPEVDPRSKLLQTQEDDVFDEVESVQTKEDPTLNESSSHESPEPQDKPKENDDDLENDQSDQ